MPESSGIETLTLSQIWTVAATLGGFQVVALAWRIRREIYMEEQGETTWLTLADLFVATSFLVIIGGVFLPPIWGVSTFDAIRMLGLALIIFAPSVFTLAGHYNLYGDFRPKFRRYRRRGPRGRCTKQEIVAAATGVIAIIAYVVLAWYALPTHPDSPT